MTAPTLKRPRTAKQPRKPLFAHAGVRGCGRSAGTPGYQPKHAAVTPTEDPRPTRQWPVVWEEGPWT